MKNLPNGVTAHVVHDRYSFIFVTVLDNLREHFLEWVDGMDIDTEHINIDNSSSPTMHHTNRGEAQAMEVDGDQNEDDDQKFADSLMDEIAENDQKEPIVPGTVNTLGKTLMFSSFSGMYHTIMMNSMQTLNLSF